MYSIFVIYLSPNKLNCMPKFPDVHYINAVLNIIIAYNLLFNMVQKGGGTLQNNLTFKGR